KAHFNGAHALALANRAASITRIEREAGGAPAANLRIACFRKLTSYIIPEADIGRRARTRRFADRRLVHLKYTVQAFPAGDIVTTTPWRRCLGADHSLKIIQQDVARQRGFAGAGDPGNHAEAALGYANIHVPQIMQMGAMDLNIISIGIGGLAGP